MNNDVCSLADEMMQLMDEKARYKFELKQLEKKEELLSVKFIQLLKENNLNEIQLPTCHFGMKIQKRTAFDQKLFEQDNKELYEKYKTTKEKEVFEFKLGAA